MSVVGVQLAETEVIEDGEEGAEGGAIVLPEEATATTVEPVRRGCWVLVAITVTVPAVAGVVSTPFGEMEPALADQATAELKLPVP